MGRGRSATVGGAAPTSLEKQEIKKYAGFDNLNDNLQTRPEKCQLVEKDILKPYSSNTSAEDLEGALDVAVKLKIMLEGRPGEDELLANNILKVGYGVVSSNLVSSAEGLKKNQLADSLNKQIGQRPDGEELKQRNIILEE